MERNRLAKINHGVAAIEHARTRGGRSQQRCIQKLAHFWATDPG
jgi:hypothetical protein